MLSFLWDLLIGRFCTHRWTVLRWGAVDDEFGHYVGRYYDMQCERCGKVRCKRT